MKTVHAVQGAAVAVALALAGCSTTKTQADAEHDIKGKVVAVVPDKPAVTLDHEAIPELNMKAMKMEYPVADRKVLDGLQVGDQVQGRVKKTDSGYLITRLEKR
jgi:Cu/Ag efflux protein CusF